jgi:hypothetical protein
MDAGSNLNASHRDTCVVMESGAVETHGRYVGIRSSDGVPQFELKNEHGTFCLRRVQYDGKRLWVLTGTLDGEVGAASEKRAYYFNSEGADEDTPPTLGWGLAQHGKTPLPVVVFQSSLRSAISRGKSRGGASRGGRRLKQLHK